MLDVPEMAASTDAGFRTAPRLSTPGLLKKLLEAASAASDADREQARLAGEACGGLHSRQYRVELKGQRDLKACAIELQPFQSGFQGELS